MGEGSEPVSRAGGTHHNGAHVPRIVVEAKRADDALCEVVRKKPITSICAALAVGYVIGRVLARRG